MTAWTATEAERWAEARDLIRLHGDDTPKVYAAECLKLAEIADWDGIGRWVELIHRCEVLRHEPPGMSDADRPAFRSTVFDDR